MRLPQHLAIIMDGNGRWAEQRRLPRIAGHRKGVETVQQVVRGCRERGIRYLTLYAFSSENWGRPDEEVGALMSLLGVYLRRELKTMLREGICLRVIGETSRLPVDVQGILQDAVARTADRTAMTLTLALSYGSRDELLRAIRTVGARVAAGEMLPEQVDEEVFSGCLDTAGLPDPDLLIRTSGEMRISNFLLWQIAYTELYFSDVYWPDFSVQELQLALEEYARRQRRFGLTGRQIREGGQH